MRIQLVSESKATISGKNLHIQPVAGGFVVSEETPAPVQPMLPGVVSEPAKRGRKPKGTGDAVSAPAPTGVGGTVPVVDHIDGDGDRAAL